MVVAFQAVKSRGSRRLSGAMPAGAPRRRDAQIARRSPTIVPYSGPNSAFDSASRPLRVDDFGPEMRHGGLGRGGIRGVADGPDRGGRLLTHDAPATVAGPVRWGCEADVAGQTKQVAPGDLVAVPAGTLHNFRNTGVNPLVLYTVYGPPEHAAGAAHVT